jgi:glutathione S-transferase
MKLVIGNKNYSTWSLRGWLAVKQSGLAFDEIVIPLYDENWARMKRTPLLAPSLGRVPILWDGDRAVWDSMAILDYLADRVGQHRYWPLDETARAMARSMAAEMHSGYLPLRRQCRMNFRTRFAGIVLDAEARGNVDRIVQLWISARTRFGTEGDFLFGAFSAADIAFAPVAGRFVANGIDLPEVAAAYVRAILEQEWMQEWIAGARVEPWVIEKLEKLP